LPASLSCFGTPAPSSHTADGLTIRVETERDLRKALPVDHASDRQILAGEPEQLGGARAAHRASTFPSRNAELTTLP